MGLQMHVNDALKFVKENSGHRKERVSHTIGVYETALKLARKHQVNTHQVALAAIFHDLAKGMMTIDEQRAYIEQHMDVDLIDEHPNLWHGFVASDYIKRHLNIRDKSIEKAIFYHVTGHPKLDEVGKILYIADFCEPGRKFHESTGKKMLKVALKDLNKGALEVALLKTNFTVKSHKPLNKVHKWSVKMIEKLESEVKHDRKKSTKKNSGTARR